MCLLSACKANSEQSEKLLIATAANMQFAMKNLVSTFTEESGIECEIILSSSGKLSAQIMAGAPYDVFVSANELYPNELYQNGLTLDAPKTYALGQLVVWTQSQTDLSEWWLSEPSKVALANPETAPYGIAAKEVLQALQLMEKWNQDLVYGESIAQVNQFVNSGAASIGFTAGSVVRSPELEAKGSWIAVADSLHSPIAQGAVILKNKEGDYGQARKFYDFLFSDKAREILHNFGYTATGE